MESDDQARQRVLAQVFQLAGIKNSGREGILRCLVEESVQPESIGLGLDDLADKAMIPYSTRMTVLRHISELKLLLATYFESSAEGRTSPYRIEIEYSDHRHRLRFVPQLEASSPLRVFLCHSSRDKAGVRRLRERLSLDGFAPWLDEVEILPGQNWEDEIRKAVRKSDVVLVCLSASSITKEGFVQKEIRMALNVAEEKPDGTLYIIPVRLEQCPVPERLTTWQWVDLFAPDGYSRLLKSLNSMSFRSK